MTEKNMEFGDVRISVVIPVYNSERTLDACIRSLLNQSFKPFEIFIVDSGSRDGTRRIAEELSKESSIIKYSDVGFERRNISYARNFGANLSSGNYLLFVDSDWILDSNALQRLSELAVEGAICVVASANRKKLDDEVSYITKSRQVLWTTSVAQSYLNYVPHKPGSPVGNPYFIQRDAFLRLGGFDTKLPALEDADLYVRCVLSGVHPKGPVNLGIHDQTITLRTIVIRRIRSAHAAWAFERKWGSTGWVRNAKTTLKKKQNLFLRWLKGIRLLFRREPILLPGALLISIVDGMSLITAHVISAFHRANYTLKL